MLKNAPPLFELARRFEEHAKGMVVPGTIFEEFGFNYVGPIDGHDLDSLIPTLENLRDLKGPQFLHVVTKKGYGYKLAEADPVNYHGPGKFDPAVGLVKPATPPKPTFTQVFGQWLCDMAAADERLVGITPAMREGSGMVEFEQRFPERYLDVGIAEQHAVTFAAGLACEGLKPVVAIYSTFLQRAYDQLIHDVAIQNLPVVFALDRAGLVGADGATHAGAYDIAYLRCIPNMGADGAGRRERMPPGADHRLPAGPPGGGALPARRRCRRPRSQAALTTTAVRQGRMRARSAAAAQRIAILAFGTLLLSGAGGGREARRHGGQHALRQAARRRAGGRTGAQPRRHRHGRRGLHDGRRRQRGAGGAAGGRLSHAGARARPARRVHRARRPGQAAGHVRARRRRHRAVDRGALRRPAGAGAALNG